MIDKLQASVRDIVLAGFAAFVGALGVVIAGGDFSYPVLKAGVIAAAYAALRAIAGAVAARLAK